jgi:hypothetical protein
VEIEEAKETARAEAAARYEAALQKQTELLRIQQERIRLQTLLIERQREELHTLSTPREVETVVKSAAFTQQTRAASQAQQVPAVRHAHWGGAAEAEMGDGEDEQYYYTSSAPPLVEMPFSPPIDAVGVWGQASSGLQDSISMLSGSEMFENASSDGNNNQPFEKNDWLHQEEQPLQLPCRANLTPPTPRNTVNLSIEGKAISADALHHSQLMRESFSVLSSEHAAPSEQRLEPSTLCRRRPHARSRQGLPAQAAGHLQRRQQAAG